MDIRKPLFYSLFVIALFAACSTDDGDNVEIPAADKISNRWIYDTMKVRYLWNDEIRSNVNFNETYYEFFDTLLSKKDGKHTPTVDYYYSYIYKYLPETSTRADEDYYRSSFGFDYIITQSFLYDPLVSNENYFSKLYATVAYVIPGSPADSARLSRGTHIYKIGGKDITRDNYRKQLAGLRANSSGVSTVTFTTCQLENPVPVKAELVNEEREIVDAWRVTHDKEKDRTVTLTSSVIDFNPILRNIVIDTTGAAGNRKIGYLVYNEFERGGASMVYDQRLREAFATFQGQGITDLVVDLRYNGGGYVSSCQLLASLIVPASLTGRVFQQQEYNDLSRTNVNYISQPNSVGMNRVYILAGANSASASEALIHGLAGSGIEIYHIGSKTEGKNVGMTLYSTEDLNPGSKIKQDLQGVNYDAWPVTFRILDAKGGTYPTDGLVPDYKVYEEFEVEFLDLGNPKEPLLNAAITHILTGNFPSASGRTRAGDTPTLNMEPMPRSVKPVKGYLDGKRDRK